MSMFNDIVWKKNDENCVSNAEEVKNYAMRFSIEHWTFLGPGSEEKWHGSSNHAQKGQWNCTADNMVQRFKETGHPVLKSISALSRGILKAKERHMYHSLQWSFYKVQNSCSKQFTLSNSSVSAEQLRIGVIDSVRQKKKTDEQVLLWTTRF